MSETEQTEDKPVPPGGVDTLAVTTRGRGRPTKFTPEVRQKILQALQGGNYRKVAAQYAGVSPAVFYKWLNIGQNPDAPDEYREFVEAVEKAESLAEVATVAAIRTQAPEKWQAAAFLLERKHPERWGRRDTTAVEVSGPDGGPIEHSHGGLVPDAAIAQLVAALEARAADAGVPVDVVDAEVVEG